MSFDSIFFILGSAFQSIFKNKLLTFVSISVMTICLIVTGSILLIIENANIFMNTIGAQNEIVAYIDESYTQQQINEIDIQFQQITNIKDVLFVSKETAWEDYLKDLENTIGYELFKDLGPETLRNKYQFTIIDLNKYDATMYSVKQIEGLDFKENKETIDRMIEIRKVLSFLSVWLIVIFLLVSAFIVTNSVKLSIYTRRNEIGIMKFIGATDWFIQIPYFIEGIIIGVTSAILALFLQIYLYNSIISPILSDMNFFIPMNIEEYHGTLVAVFFGFGLIVGFIGSIFPLKKYVDV